MSSEPAARGEPGAPAFDAFGLLARFAPLIFLLVLMAVFAAVDPRFLKPLNLFNVMRQVSIYGLLAIGMTFVILTRGIALSVGSAEARAWGWPAALLAFCLIGTACGWLQGQAITRLKLPPFAVTLGGMSAFRGLARYMAGGGPVSGFDEACRWWGQGYVGPVPVIIFLACGACPPRADLEPLWPRACPASAASSSPPTSTRPRPWRT